MTVLAFRGIGVTYRWWGEEVTIERQKSTSISDVIVRWNGSTHLTGLVGFCRVAKNREGEAHFPERQKKVRMTNALNLCEERRTTDRNDISIGTMGDLMPSQRQIMNTPDDPNTSPIRKTDGFGCVTMIIRQIWSKNSQPKMTALPLKTRSEPWYFSCSARYSRVPKSLRFWEETQ
jgi:hypothetical protein